MYIHNKKFYLHIVGIQTGMRSGGVEIIENKLFSIVGIRHYIIYNNYNKQPY